MFFGKKGSVVDIITIAVVLFALIITVIFVYKISTAMNDKIQGSDTISTRGKAAADDIHSRYPGWLDTLFFIIWIVFFLAAVISAWFIDTHPVFFFLSLIVTIAVLVGLVPINNVLEGLMSADEFATIVTEFPIILFFINNFFKIMVVEAFVILISLYAKYRSEQ